MRLLFLVIALLGTATVIAGSGRAIDWYSIDGGGTMDANGGSWNLQGSFGQADATSASAMTGSGLSLTGGFWSLNATALDDLFRDRFEGRAFSFSSQLAPSFRHPRCTTCHAVAATDFRRVTDNPPGVLPAAHPVVSASTDCTGCHNASVLPIEGTIDPGWQSAPIAFDFRDRSDLELCNLASQPVSGHSPLEHMSEDKLVLWAVGDGRLPFGGTVPTAPPNDIAQWRGLIQQWVAAGMPCD
ncbi:hypothetical protein [Wenzhouxiangella marina]|uniref:Uncharacterized protein n=1 Tax=Wenzhouxiangella marina TaxID=1579979 RepID=A0A0K0XZB1_9GAMM|nr:hypothetical protein [Wenzhouxiangella marina]AKS43024.1 hypothetical protein WM2015_2666 [Wenzhouxiangella marina]MBB6087293.1 hypothetical protein [Wenzhouxiangella marina]